MRTFSFARTVKLGTVITNVLATGNPRLLGFFDLALSLFPVNPRAAFDYFP